MFVFGSSTSHRHPGPDVAIDCPRCGAADATAETYELEEKVSLYFIPVPNTIERHVVCLACGHDYVTPLALAELRAMSPHEIGRYLRERVSIVTMALAVLSLLLVVVPIIPLVLGGIAVAQTWRSRTWPFKVSVAAVALNVCFCGVLLVRAWWLGQLR